MRGRSQAWCEAAFWAASLGLLLSVRLCHAGVLWADEAYGLAGARRLLEGAALYRDFWFDKPPLYAWIYLCWGARIGWPLRLGGALYALLTCWLAGRAAKALFGRREGLWAAGAMAFFLSFDHPAAIISPAPDFLLLPFTLGTVWALAAGRPAAAGFSAAAGLLANVKALALPVLAVLWRPADWKRIVAAYAAGFAAVWIAADGWQEPVWAWGLRYAGDSFLSNPLLEGLRRTANWAGFHAALVMAAALYFRRADPLRGRLAAWLALSLGMVAAGARFFPRYYLALLPALATAAARGAAAARGRRMRVVLALALLVPAVRFGSRHVATLLGRPSAMRDLALWEDCREAAGKIRALARPGDTLLVWGYRPELTVLAGLPGGTPFLDSQPLTGVLADRHLRSDRPTAAAWSQRNRRRLAQTRPTFIADGLGPLNPVLAVERYPDLHSWLADYEPAAETRGFRIWRRK